MPVSTYTRITISFGAILMASCLAVCSRIYVRLVIVKKIDVDDIFIIITMILFTGMSGLAIEMARLGLGVKDHYLSTENISQIIKLYYINEISYVITTLTLKMSITLLLLKFAQERYYRFAIIGTMAFYGLCGAVFLPVIIFQCNPVASLWEDPTHQHCFKRSTFVALIFCNAVIGLVTDLIFAIIPIAIIWNVQMPKKTKFSTGLVLSLGLTTGIVNIARFFYIGALRNTVDMPYKFFPIGILSMLELGIGIIAASLATIRPLLQRMFKSFGSITSYNRSTQKSRTRSDDVETTTSTFSIKFGKGTTIPHRTCSNRSEEDTNAPVMTGIKIEQSDIEEWAALCSATHIKAATETEALKKACVKRNSVNGSYDDDGNSEMYQVIN